MEYVSVGCRGPVVSRIGLGTINFGTELSEEEASKVLSSAADAGINHFDTANVYPTPVAPENWGRSEAILGRWLTKRRNSMVIATKCLNRVGHDANDQGGSRKHIIEACERSLRRLKTDRVDIMYLMYLQADQLNAPLDETFEALDRLMRSGKILHIGVSNFSLFEIAPAMEIIAQRGLRKIDVVQVRYNLLNRIDEREVLPLAKASGMGVVTYNPLAGGLLAGLFERGQALPVSGRFAQPIYQHRYWNEKTFDVVDAVSEVAGEEGLTPAQVALAWVLSKSGTMPLIGALNPQQLTSNLKALDAAISPESLSRLTAASAPFA